MKLCPVCQRCYEDTNEVCSFDNAALLFARHGPPMIAGKYHLERLLGRGGMGAVYAGTHVDLERAVAIKLLLPDFTSDQEALERFRREARAAARLNHPNVADTYDYGSLPDGGAYIVMELIDGQTLRERMNAGRNFHFAEAILIARQVASGVEAAHRSGITHRDLKPSNIILTLDHDRMMLAKVVDFSVAKLKEGTTSSAALTATGSLIGTPRYMAPEQCADNKTDARSDIYSLGVILYEMLAGRPPFDGPTTTAIAIKHIQEPPPPIKEFRRDVPEALQKLIMESLAKSPAARPQTALEFNNRLAEAAKDLPEGEELLQTTIASEIEADTPAASTRRDYHTNPQTNDSGPHTGRTGEPTREDSFSTSQESETPSVQAHAVSPVEPDKEVETKVSSPSKTQDDKKEDKYDGESDKAARSAQPEAEDNFPLLSTHSKTDASAAPVSQPSALPPTPAQPTRAPYHLLAIAAAILVTTGIIAFIVASQRAPGIDSTATISQTNTSNINSAVSNTANNQPALSDANTAPSPTTTPGDVRAELLSLRDQWINATTARDIEKVISFYPPVVETFYRKHNVARSAVRVEKQRLLEQANSIEMRASEPQTTINGDTATMTFRKSWNFRGAQSSRGEVVQELRWVKTNQGWKISSERDIEVIR